MASFDKAYSMVYDDEIERFTKDFTEELRQYSAKGMESEMNEIMDMIHKSHDELVPIDTGATKDSWYQEIEISGDEIKATFGNDLEGQLDYVPFIYLGLDTEGNPISFNYGRIPYWLEAAFHNNLDAISRKLSKPKTKK